MSLSEFLHQHRKRPFRKFIIFLFLFVALSYGIYYYLQQKNLKETRITYVSQDVERGDLKIEIIATGNLIPTNQVTVGSELSGTIIELHADINDSVEKGQILAKLDTSKLEQLVERGSAAILSARARISIANATKKEAVEKLHRLQELHRISGGETPAKSELDSSTATLERAEADLAVTNAALTDAEASLRTLTRDREKANICSPISGTILSRKAQLGQTVAASFQAPELFLIAEDLKQMKLDVSVNEADIANIRPELSAQFFVDAWPSRSYQAKVSRVTFGSTLKNNIVTYNTELLVANDDLSLRPGMTATADISISERKNVIVIPNSALRFKPDAYKKTAVSDAPKVTFAQSLTGGPKIRRNNSQAPTTSEPPARKVKTNQHRVWVLDPSNDIREIQIKTGLSNGRQTEVLEGELKEGMKIVTSIKIPSK